MGRLQRADNAALAWPLRRADRTHLFLMNGWAGSVPWQDRIGRSSSPGTATGFHEWSRKAARHRYQLYDAPEGHDWAGSLLGVTMGSTVLIPGIPLTEIFSDTHVVRRLVISIDGNGRAAK
jgi:hypothetical protein